MDSCSAAGIKYHTGCTQPSPETRRQSGSMKRSKISRRDALKGGFVGGLLAGTALSTRALAEAPPAEPVTPALIAAARKEGQVIHYNLDRLAGCREIGKVIRGEISRHRRAPSNATGAEPGCFKRIGQEYSSNIHAVDVVNSSDAAHFIVWKRDGVSRALRARGCRQILSAGNTGISMASSRVWRIFLSIIAYNTKPREGRGCAEEFRRFCSIPNGRARSSRAHPGYSGTHHDRDLSVCSAISAGLGSSSSPSRTSWQVAIRPPTRPKKLDLGERAVMAGRQRVQHPATKGDGTPG